VASTAREWTYGSAATFPVPRRTEAVAIAVCRRLRQGLAPQSPCSSRHQEQQPWIGSGWRRAAVEAHCDPGDSACGSHSNTLAEIRDGPAAPPPTCEATAQTCSPELLTGTGRRCSTEVGGPLGRGACELGEPGGRRRSCGCSEARDLGCCRSRKTGHPPADVGQYGRLGQGNVWGRECFGVGSVSGSDRMRVRVRVLADAP
jgi:hypothetical protein